MKAKTFCRAFALGAVLLSSAHATPPPPVAASEAPDGSPSLPKDTSITNVTADTIARDAGVSQVGSEERIESRLAVIRNGRATVTDPNVGRYDRVQANGQRRVTPTMWQVFRF